MGTYTIKEKQSSVDVSNQLYGDQDHLYDLLLANDEFDINLNQYGLTLEYDEDRVVNNTIVNAVNVNNYTFINGEPTSIYTKVGDITLDIGFNDLSFLSAYYGVAFMVNNTTKEAFFLDDETSLLTVYEDDTVYSIYVEDVP